MNRRQMSTAMVLGGAALAIGRYQGQVPSVQAGGWASLELINPLNLAIVGVPAVIDAQVLQHGVAPNAAFPAAIRFIHEVSGEEEIAHLDVISEEHAIVRGEHSFTVPGTWRMLTHQMGPEVELGALQVIEPPEGAVLSALHAGAGLEIACSGGGVAGAVETEILDAAFAEPALEVAVGETVTWVNTSVLPHQVVFEERKLDGSAMLKEGDRFSVTFDEEGDYAYYCAPHPSMTGVVRVR